MWMSPPQIPRWLRRGATHWMPAAGFRLRVARHPSAAPTSTPTSAPTSAAAGGPEAWLADLGALAGSADILEHARLANVHPPLLRTHDRFGHRIDEVEFHPSWHWLMRPGGRRRPARPRRGRRPPGRARTPRRRPASTCGRSSSRGTVPDLDDVRGRARAARTTRRWPRSSSRACASHHVRVRPRARPRRKPGCSPGMSMTEKQGGSDVRANTTPRGAGRGDGHLPADRAQVVHLGADERPVPHAGAGAGRADLLRAPPGAARRHPQRHRGCMRLKDKLGNRSNASAEIEYDGAVGWRLGDEGRGVATIIEMVSMTRLDCVLGSAGADARGAVGGRAPRRAPQRVRRAAGGPAVDAAVIADLAVESEAATLPALRLAGRGSTATSAALLRLALPAAKYWVCKRAAPVVAEALECLGGNGFVEDFRAAAAAPRGAAQLDLGGLGQRHRAGRAARGEPRARGRRGAARRAGRAGGADSGSTARCGSCAPSCAAATGRGPATGRAARPLSPRPSCCGSPRPRWPTCSGHPARGPATAPWRTTAGHLAGPVAPPRSTVTPAR